MKERREHAYEISLMERQRPAGVRERNVGWRIDYFLGSDRLMDKVSNAVIYAGIYGSDHCPEGIEIK